MIESLSDVADPPDSVASNNPKHCPAIDFTVLDARIEVYATGTLGRMAKVDRRRQQEMTVPSVFAPCASVNRLLPRLPRLSRY
jgi:hypothetical protein